MELETVILSEAQTKTITIVHNVTETKFHTVIEDFYRNDDHLYKIEDSMKLSFPIFNQEFMRLEVSNKSNINNRNLRQRNQRKQLVPSLRKPSQNFVPTYYGAIIYMK